MISRKRPLNLIRLLAAGAVLLGSARLARTGESSFADGPAAPSVIVRGQMGSPFAPAEKKPSFSDSIKGGFDKMTGAFSTKKGEKPPAETKDELSLANKAKPSPRLHTSLARVFESQGRLNDAESEYRKALKLDRKSLLALLEYARFLDRQEQFDAAIGLYRHAEQLHATDPSVQNDLGLCLARHGRSEQAVTAFEKAVALAPGNVLYRNNLAMVLVDLERYDEALSHLIAGNGRGVAEYNMGYLLQKTGRPDLADRHFRAAAEHNPQMRQAQWWVANLDVEGSQLPNPAELVAEPVQARQTAVPPPTRLPQYTADRRQTADVPMIWVQSSAPAGNTPPGHSVPAGVERVPPLRQPANSPPSRGTIRDTSAPLGATERLPSQGRTEVPALEPLPPIRR